MPTAKPETTRVQVMKRALTALALLGAGTGLSSIVCCGSADAFTAGPTRGGDAGHTDNSADAAGPVGEPLDASNQVPTGVVDGGAASLTPLDARGVIIVHGSPSLPAFRLCFGAKDGAGSLRPLPDRELMPESNVVGVELGSAVRLKPLTDYGLTGNEHVYAIPEHQIRPGTGSDLKCSARICDTALSASCMEKNPAPGQRGYYDLGPLPTDSKQKGAMLLVVHGCVRGTGTKATCGDTFDATKGNLTLMRVALQGYLPNLNDLAIDVAQLSTAVAGEELTVTPLAPPLDEQPLASLTSAFGATAPVTLNFDRQTPAVYLSQGFTVTIGGRTFRKSLAEIQVVSAPQTTPEEFYSAKSNFIFALLGDPALSGPDGGALSETTDPGLLVHFLAVPVALPLEDGGIEPGDAGDAGEAGDAGVSDAATGG